MIKKTLCIAGTLLGLICNVHAVDAKVLFAYTQRAADMNGGAANLESRINSALATSNQVHLNSHQGVNYIKWLKVGWYKTNGLADLRDGGSILRDLSNNIGGANIAARNVGANLVSLCADTTNVGGIAYQPGQHSIVDAQWPYWQFYAHEIGHNYNGAHDAGLCWSCNGAAYRTVMKHNYCGGTTIQFFSNPSIYTQCRYIGDSTHDNAKRMRDSRWTRAAAGF